MNANKSLKVNVRRGFTLVELLTVITIIVILAGLTVGTMGWVQRKAAVNKARAQLALLENGLERYHADTGIYPEARDTKGLILYYCLFGDGVGADGIRGTSDDGAVDGKPDEGATVYLSELDPHSNSMQLLDGAKDKAPDRLMDPFGNAWSYTGGEKYKRNLNNPDFDLSSYGPDGRNKTDDDISNY